MQQSARDDEKKKMYGERSRLQRCKGALSSEMKKLSVNDVDDDDDGQQQQKRAKAREYRILIDEMTTLIDDIEREERLQPNERHPSVPCKGKNVVTKVWGQSKRKPFTHIELMTKLGFDELQESAVKIGGKRAYALQGPLVLLQEALVQFSLGLLVDRGFVPMYLPALMKREHMSLVSCMDDDETYGLDRADLCLAPTSEHPLTAMHADSVIATPVRIAGLSECFRPEVGAHGRETRGLFRVHQFRKVEQFMIVDPESSWHEYQGALDNAEELYTALEIPFRRVNVDASDLNKAAAKKEDVEAWFAGSNDYKEVVSCTNCTDYHAKRLSILCVRDAKKIPAHTINSTMCATTRVICAILEQHQDDTGIVVPKVLRPYMTADRIPFLLK